MKKERRAICGVYILFDDDDDILYIGQSLNIAKRLEQHKKNKIIPFTWMIYLEIDPEFREDMEAALINIRQPKYNRLFPKMPKVMR